MSADLETLQGRIEKIPDHRRAKSALFDATNPDKEGIMNIPDVAGYKPMASGMVDIASPYAQYIKLEGTAETLDTFYDTIRRLHDQSGQVDGGHFETLLNYATKTHPPLIDNEQKTVVLHAFQQYGLDPSEDTLRNMQGVLEQVFPTAFEPVAEPQQLSEAEIHSALAEQVSRLLIPGVPYEEIAFVTTSSRFAWEALCEQHVEPNQTTFITPIPNYFRIFEIAGEAGANLHPIDTLETDCKLTPEALQRAIDEGDIKKGDWVVLVNPGNINMKEYTRDELQALAEIIAKHELNAVSDELYANSGRGEHVSLASLDVEGPNGYRLQDHVLTVTSKSKQLQPYDYPGTFGVICGPSALMEGIAAIIEREGTKLDPQVAENHAIMLLGITERDIAEGRERVAEAYDNVRTAIDGLNQRLGSEVFILNGSDHGYLATLTLSQDVIEKADIENSEDMQIRMMQAGVRSHPLGIMGIEDPINRVNLTQVNANLDVVVARLEAFVHAVEQGRLPRMETIREATAEHVQDYQRQLATEAGRGGMAI